MVGNTVAIIAWNRVVFVLTYTPQCFIEVTALWSSVRFWYYTHINGFPSKIYTRLSGANTDKDLYRALSKVFGMIAQNHPENCIVRLL